MQKFLFFLIYFLSMSFLFAQIKSKPLPPKIKNIPQVLQQKEKITLKNLEVKKTVDINKLRLNHSFPNILKGMYISVDETTGYVYLAGILTHYIYEVSPIDGKVLRFFDTGLEGTHYSKIRIEPFSKTLFYVTTDGEIVSYDLKTGKQKGNYSYQKKVLSSSEKKFITPVKRNPDLNIFPETLVDKNSHKLLVICREENSIYVFDDKLNLVKNINLSATPIHIVWSDFYNSVVLSIGERNSPFLKFIKLNVNEGKTEEILTLNRPKPERLFEIDENGNFYLLGNFLIKFDQKGKEIWRVEIKDTPSEMEYFKGAIALIFQDGHAKRNEGGKPSCVDFYDISNGTFSKQVQVRFEAHTMAVDNVNNRLFIGNGGDGSFSIIDLKNKEQINTFRVCSSAEEVIYDREEKCLYILNRLAGSEIYKYNLLTGSFETINAGNWPVDMAFSPERKKLYVMSHYEGDIYVIDTETFKVIEKIPLGIIGSKTDTMSYMAFNSKRGILCAGHPETADLVILNVDTKNIIKIKPKGATPLIDEGPGQWHLQISAEGEYILLYMDKLERLVKYNTKGIEISSVEFKLEPSKTYNQEIFRIIPSTGQIYLGPFPIFLNPLKVGQPVKFIHRVLDIDTKNNVIYGNHIEKNGEESLVLLDLNSNKILNVYKIDKNDVIPSNCYFDIREGVYFATDMTNARVYQFLIPILLK